MRVQHIVIVCVIALLIITSVLYAQSEIIAIKGGTFLTIHDGILKNAVLLIQDGKISALGNDVQIPAGTHVINSTGKTITPGFIDCFTNLGIADLPSFGTDDVESTSPITPQLRVIDALNPDNRFLSIARAAGITTAVCAPGEANLLSGQSAIIRLAGTTIEEMTLTFPSGIHGSLGEAPKKRFGANEQAPMTRMGSAAMLRQTFLDVQEYLSKIKTYKKKLTEYKNDKNSEGKEPAAPEKDLKLQALIPVLKREIPCIISASRMDDILTALRIADEFNIDIILNHGIEAYRIADKLAARNIPVIIGPTTLHFQTQETLRAKGENAYLLHQAGVKIAFQTGSIKNVSGLLHEAKKAAEYGLPREEALKALTLYPAQIFHVDKQLGSLEVGKSADIVLFDADPIQENSSVKMVLIQGKIVFQN